MSTFSYKGYTGSIEARPEDGCLYGKVLFVNDLVTYEAQTIPELEKEFKKSVDDYLDACKKLGREPVKQFKGSFNVRIGKELHKEAALFAAILGITLNEYIKLAVTQQVRKDEDRL